MNVPAKQIYRCYYSTLLLWMIAVLWLFDLFRIAFFLRVPLGSIDYAGSLELITIISLITSSILVWALISEISSDGVYSYTWWGKSLFIPWNEIANAHTRNYLGLGYYCITGTNGNRVYIARYLSRQDEFKLLVSAITNRENPLRLCIEGQNDLVI